MRWDYDLIALGGGAAGLTAAGLGAQLGARTLLVERGRLGGECTWTGCIPSKALLHAAETAWEVRKAGRMGLAASLQPVELDRVMSRVREVQQAVYEDADRPEIYVERGADVRTAEACFQDPHTVLLRTPDGSERRVTARYFVIATGSSPVIPPVSGLQEAPHLTNESVFRLEKLPKQLVVLGAGPVGIEMAQAFHRLGSRVAVVEMMDRILPKDDPELSRILWEKLLDEGIHFHLSSRATSVTREGEGITVTLEDGTNIPAGQLLVAAGRRPNVEGLNLETAGVRYGKSGIAVDDRCRTSQRHIFATGDVTGRMPFTHAAEEMSKVAVLGAIFRIFGPKVRWDLIPWVTYTDPELAHVGSSEEELRRKGRRYRVYRFPYDRIDRAVTMGKTGGMIKIRAHPWTGRIYGADILGAGAGELIGQICLAMRGRISIGRLSRTVHPYPTLVLGNRRAADQWYVQKRSPRVIRFLQILFGYRGKVPPPPRPDEIV